MEAKCPGCGAVNVTQPEMVGELIACGNCQSKFTVTAPKAQQGWAPQPPSAPQQGWAPPPPSAPQHGWVPKPTSDIQAEPTPSIFPTGPIVKPGLTMAYGLGTTFAILSVLGIIPMTIYFYYLVIKNSVEFVYGIEGTPEYIILIAIIILIMIVYVIVYIFVALGSIAKSMHIMRTIDIARAKAQGMRLDEWRF